MVNDLRVLDGRAERFRTALRRKLLVLDVLFLAFLAEDVGRQLARLKERYRVVDVVGKEAHPVALALVLLELLALETDFEHREEYEVGVRVGRDGAHFDARGALVPHRDSDHRAAVYRRNLYLIGSLEVRVEPPVRVDRGVEDEARLRGVVQHPEDEIPRGFGEAVGALRVVEDVLPALRERKIGVHARAVDADERLRKKARRE